MQWPTGTTSPTNSTLANTSTCMYAGDYAVYNVVLGETYQWTTCSSSAFDTQLTLQQGVGCAGADLAFNEDDCGLQSTIIWTATFTGQVSILVTQYNCATNSICMTLQHACISCGGGSGYNHPGGTITTCTGTYYDSGGAGGNYSNNESTVTTFCPDTPGACMQASFSSFDTEGTFDRLIIYDGPSTASPSLGTFSGTASPGTISATVANASGCLTFEFISDISLNYGGWAATLSCVPCAPDPNITACSGNFYDSGGPSGNYGIDELTTTTICPDTPGQCIAIDFTMVDIEYEWDYLYVYNGTSTTDPYLGYLTGVGTAYVAADASNPSGCLTFEFDSDGSGQYAGWAGTISCIDCDTPTAPINDCIGGQTICSDATLSGNASGDGSIIDLDYSNDGCLAGENQSSWYLFSPATSGNIGFTLSPNSGVDYDFAIWGPYAAGSTANDVCSPSGNPIRCSYASGPSTFSATGSYDTGIGHPTYSPPQFAAPIPAHSETPGGDGWVPGLTVTAGQVYVLVIDNWTANSTPFTMDWTLTNGATLDCTVLPVELLSFVGEHKSGENILSWKTASEQNADYFEIQRSDNGVDYHTLGTVPAQGNSSTVKDYVFVDKSPTRLHYYRLNQVDINGQAKKYGPVAINLQGSGTTVLPAFPNPVTDNILHVPFSLVADDEVTYQIINLTGQVLLQQTIALGAGNHEVDLNLETVASGLYHLRITDSAQRQIYSGKVVK